MVLFVRFPHHKITHPCPNSSSCSEVRHTSGMGRFASPQGWSIYKNCLEFSVGDFPLLLYILIYWIIYLYHYGLRDIAFKLWVNSIFCLLVKYILFQTFLLLFSFFSVFQLYLCYNFCNCPTVISFSVPFYFFSLHFHSKGLYWHIILTVSSSASLILSLVMSIKGILFYIVCWICSIFFSLFFIFAYITHLFLQAAHFIP